MVRDSGITSDDLVVDIEFNDGQGFINCDIPSSPFEQESMFSFWQSKDELCTVPRNQIACLIFHSSK